MDKIGQKLHDMLLECCDVATYRRGRPADHRSRGVCGC